MTAGSQQQTARVNLDDERWREFRILAIESDRSIAEYLGQLVPDELRRCRKRKRRAHEDASQTARDAPPPARPANEAAPRIRLADAQLLTELPRPDESLRRSL